MEVFLTVFIITFSCTAVATGLFAAKFGEDMRRSLGLAYVGLGLLGFVSLVFLTGLFGVKPPEPYFIGMETLVTVVFVIVSVLVGTLVGFALVFFTTLSSE